MPLLQMLHLNKGLVWTPLSPTSAGLRESDPPPPTPGLLHGSGSGEMFIMSSCCRDLRRDGELPWLYMRADHAWNRGGFGGVGVGGSFITPREKTSVQQQVVCFLFFPPFFLFFRGRSGGEVLRQESDVGRHSAPRCWTAPSFSL